MTNNSLPMLRRTRLHSAAPAIETDFRQNQATIQTGRSIAQIPRSRRWSRLRFWPAGSSLEGFGAGIVPWKFSYSHQVARDGMSLVIRMESIIDNAQAHVKFLRRARQVCDVELIACKPSSPQRDETNDGPNRVESHCGIGFQ